MTKLIARSFRFTFRRSDRPAFEVRPRRSRSRVEAGNARGPALQVRSADLTSAKPAHSTKLDDIADRGSLRQWDEFIREAVESARDAGIAQERARMAGEIHDGVAQAFLAVMMQARAARISGSVDGCGVSQFLDRIESLAAEGLEEARRSVFALRSSSLDSAGLIAALERLAGSLSVPGGTQCVFVNRAGTLEVAPAIEDAVYRIVQEAGQNALKHAGAKEVKVELGRADGQLEVRIEDDGLGARDDVIQRARERGGLRAMRDRAERCSGSLVIESRVPHGMRVTVLLPIGSEPE